MIGQSVKPLTGIRLGLVLAGITFIGLLLLGQRPTRVYWHIDGSPSAELRTHELDKCQRYVGLHGWDLVWGREPKPTWIDDPRLPYGLITLPLAIMFATVVIGTVLSKTTRIVLP